MSHDVIIKPEAEDDLAEAYHWYEQQRDGLGSEFVFAVEAAIAEIARRPNSFPAIHKDVHRALCRRFPYGVYFQFVDDRIIVVAIYHAKRAPWRWQRRV